VYVLQQFSLYLLLSLPLIGAYLMFAVGIVVVFRASRVLNLALGAMAVLPAYLVYSMVHAGIPTLVALVLGVLSAAALGIVVERLFIRPLARQGPTAQTVGTVAVFGLVVALLAQIYGSGSLQAVEIFPAGGVHVYGSLLKWGQLALFGIGLLSAAGCLALLRYTRLGLSMRGAAENPTAAGLMGVNPLRMARIAWAIGGAFAGLSGILLASVTSLNPYALSLQMLPGFVAALLGGLASVAGAVIGAVIVGTAQGLVPAFALVPGLRSLAGQVGVPQLVLTVLALATMYVRGQRYSTAGEAGPSAHIGDVVPTHSAFDPGRLPRRGGRRRLVRFAVLVALLAWPFTHLPSFFPVDQFSLLGDAIQAGEYFLFAASLVLLTGWVGQISLAQASFVGIGAFGTALLGRHMGMPFPVGIIAGALLGGGAAALLGVVALRVRGLYLAVGTLIFAWMADAYLFLVPWFAGRSGGPTLPIHQVGHPGTFPFFDFTQRRTFYFVVLAVCSTVLFALLNLRDSKTGRAFAAIRGSETAAAALGVDVVRTKLLAFVLAGAIAGIAGNLIITNQTTVLASQFNLQTSLLVVAIAVVGGLRSLGGAVSAAVLFAGLNELFFRVPALGRFLQLVSAVLLALVLLAYPGGLAAIPATLRRARRRAAPLVNWVTARLRPEFARLKLPAAERLTARLMGLRERSTAALTPGSTTNTPPAEAVPAPRNGNEPAPVVGPVLEAIGITVRFGGLTAVEDVSLAVQSGQIVSLIGPNGAGKTTLFNAISGLNSPTTGTVHLFGENVTALASHARAGRGLARTFQVIQLFPELTVFDNLMVATHVRNPTGPFAHITATAGAVRAESAAEERCRAMVRLLGLEEIADRGAAGLPFGTLRLVEFARALVSGAPLIMLDEAASGLDDGETDEFANVLRRVRAELGLSILLIEHDVRLVTAISDYIYVLDRGRLIASGRPAEIQRHPAVVAAYLGKSLESEEVTV
jgi:ABC-type branched-subunit amino acid transport system ATPase component/ABC-type branched-subunit amino acid transport system permease subunit